MNQIFKKIVFCLLLLPCLALTKTTPSIEKLTPPKFTKTVGQKVVCTRPMRDGKFNISKEIYEGENGPKLIFNIYGHGGSGWTTLWGSINKGMGLFKAAKVNSATPIRVIGSGCMGLTSAIELKRLGYNVVGITTKEKHDIASWRAAGYFALVSIKTSPEEQNDLSIIGIDTFLGYKLIDKGQHPYINKEAVKFMPVYCSQDTETGLEDLEAKRFIPAREMVTLDFGNGVTHPNFVKYMTYFMNTTSLMKQLTAEVQRLKIPIEVRTVHSFDEVDEEIIFNCTGLGARELCHDNLMIPVRGHLFAMDPASGTEHMEYMIYTLVKQDGKDEYVYLFPKTMSVTPDNLQGTPCAGVLGGTFIPNVDKLSEKERMKLDDLEFNRMLDRSAIFFTGQKIKK